MKKTFYTELSYLVGVVTLAFATAMMTVADLGLSMVVAPAYLLSEKLSSLDIPFASFFSFGNTEYLFQAVLILILCVVLREFHARYLLAFLTAVFYGKMLDLSLLVIHLIPGIGTLPMRLFLFTGGLFLCAFGIAFLCHTYIPPEAYELFVIELTRHFRFNFRVCKTVYDMCSLLLSVILSFLFFGFGKFEGIWWGTLICTLVNGRIINAFNKLLESRLEFRDLFRLGKSKKEDTPAG